MNRLMVSPIGWGLFLLWLNLVSCRNDEVEKRNDQVCLGDPVPVPTVAAQRVSGVEGGLFGCTRYGTGCPMDEGRKWHGGIDLLADYGDPVYAMYAGDATIHSDKDANGNTILAGHYVRVTSLLETKQVSVLYFHLQEESRAMGAVSQGDIIGYLGVSGNLGEAIEEGYAVSHVHIEVWEDGEQVNPTTYLSTEIDEITGQKLSNPPCQIQYQQSMSK